MTEVERITDPFKISFPNLGWEFTIDPTAFTIFGLEINWYGIIITFGMFVAMLWCFPKMKRFGIDYDRAIDAVIGGIIGGILGARTYYVAMSWEDYAGDWKKILNFRGGGLAIYGGLIGAVIVGLIICRIRKVKILPMLDISVIGFLIGQGIGRWGNFVNQEAFGRNTDNIFGMTGGTIQDTIIKEAAEMSGKMYQSGIEISEKFPVHPCFLYESVWCLLGAVLLSVLIKHRKYDGQLLLIYLIWYGTERFFVEGLRTDSLMFKNIRVSQALSACLVIASVTIMLIMASKVRRRPEDFILYVNTDESKSLLADAEKRKNPDISSGTLNQNFIIPDDPDEVESMEENENGTDN